MIHSKIRAFHAVATEGNFTKAARMLNVSQPAVSAQVKGLEAAYGVTLFIRENRKALLTEPGERLFEVSRRILRLEEEADGILRSVKELPSSDFKVGTDAPYGVTAILVAYCQRHPGLHVSLTMGTGEEIQHDLLNCKIDVAVLSRSQEDPRLIITPYARHQVVVIVNKSHPWAGRSSIDLEDLADQPMVLRITDNSLTGPTFEAALHKAGVKPKWIMKVDSREAMRETVAAGVGVGAIVDFEARSDRRLKALRLRNADLVISESVVTLRQRNGLPAIRSFRRIAKELVEAGQAYGPSMQSTEKVSLDGL